MDAFGNAALGFAASVPIELLHPPFPGLMGQSKSKRERRRVPAVAVQENFAHKKPRPPRTALRAQGSGLGVQGSGCRVVRESCAGFAASVTVELLYPPFPGLGGGI